MNTPRRHHFVPILLLKTFTVAGGERDRLWVFDQAQNRQWPSTPEKSAHKRHFHKIDLPNVDPMAVETGFGAFESDVAPVIRQVITTRSIPSKHSDYELFITFIALLINRVPAVRQRITDVADEVRAKEEFVRNWLRQSRKAVAEAPAETIDKTWLVENILRSVQTLVPHLAQRKWSLWFAENDAPDLICSDNAVALTWTTGVSGSWPPGFEHRRTQVSCPLSRRVLLVGSFEGQPNHAPLDALAVATANSCAGRNANQLYSATEDFVWLMQDGRIGSKADWVQALSAARK